MKPDTILALQNPVDLPSSLRGTRQGLFYLLSRNLNFPAQRTDERIRRETLPPDPPARSAASALAAFLTRDDFHFTF